MAEATSLNATVSTQASLAQCECPVNFIRATEHRRSFFFGNAWSTYKGVKST